MASTTMGSKYICKFCMKIFPCGRSLGGHIRSHLIHNNNNSSNSPSDYQSKLYKLGYELRENPKMNNKPTKLFISSPSSCSNEESETDPISINKDSNVRKRSLSEVVELDQEEIAIAMCLIMLSRDVGKCGDSSSCEFSDDILLLQPKETKKSTIKTEKQQGKCSVFGTNGIDYTYKKIKNMEFSSCGPLQNGSKMKNYVEVPSNGSDKNVSLWDLQCGLKITGNKILQNGLKLNNQFNKPSLSKRKIGHVGSDKKWSKMMEIEVCEDELVLNDQMKNINKRSKYECTSCNKVFHSYQALGGHRASHKRLLSMKNSIPNPPSNDQDQEQVTCDINNGLSSSSSLSSKKVVQNHECPINLIERSTSFEIRDVLDLNLPPTPTEEDTTSSSGNSQAELIKPYWWVESSKHEPIFSLFSN